MYLIGLELQPMRVYVCMYYYVHVCMCVCVYVRMYVHKSPLVRVDVIVGRQTNVKATRTAVIPM